MNTPSSKVKKKKENNCYFRLDQENSHRYFRPSPPKAAPQQNMLCIRPQAQVAPAPFRDYGNCGCGSHYHSVEEAGAGRLMAPSDGGMGLATEL